MKFSDEMEKMIVGTANAHGIDPELAKRLVWQESRGNPNAKSHAGAMGLTQLMPGTAQDLGVNDPWDQQQNLNGGFKYLAKQIQDFGLEKGLAAYNFGPGNVRSGKPYPQETQNYTKSILDGYSVGGPAASGLGETMSPPMQQPMQSQMPQGNNIQALLEMLNQKPSKGQMIGDILSSLAPVAAAFHSPQAQAQQSAITANRFAQQDQNQKSKVAEMLALSKFGQSDNTDDIKEFNEAKRQGYGGSFFNYMTDLRKAGVPQSDPAVKDLTQQVIEGMKKRGPKQEDQIIDLGSI